MIGMIWETGIRDPLHSWMLIEKFCCLLCILAVLFHPQGQGFEALQEPPRGDRLLAGAEIPPCRRLHGARGAEGGNSVS